MNDIEEMAELLAKFKELDPVEYHYWAAFRFALNPELEMNSLPALDHLQGCIQRAIEEHGWTWSIVNNMIGGYQYYARITLDYLNNKENLEWGKSPTEALLKAYLAALEAEVLLQQSRGKEKESEK